MSVFNVIKRNATWQVVEKAITDGAKNNKIKAEVFSAVDNTTRKVLLKNAFSKAVLSTIGEEYYGNFTCFNGEHDDRNPSMVFDKDGGHFHCFGCMTLGKNYDLFNAIEDFYGLEGFNACYNKAVELFVENPEKVTATTTYRPYPLEMYKVMRNSYYTPINQSHEGLEYMRTRGISNELSIKHGLRVWEYQGYGYIVFINDNGSVVRRCFCKNEEVAITYSNEPPNKWWNSKGDGGFFNERCVEIATAKDEIVFVTEGAIDALSVEELGFHAVGLNSVMRYRKLLENHPNAKFVILFDNDYEGTLTAANAQPFGFYTVHYDENTNWAFLSAHKDINECLMTDRRQTLIDLKNIELKAKAFYGLN